jgi:hypothetical protein
MGSPSPRCPTVPSMTLLQLRLLWRWALSCGRALPRALVGSPAQPEESRLEIHEDRSPPRSWHWRPGVHPAPPSLGIFFPKLWALCLPPYWEVTEELVELMAQNMPGLAGFGVCLEAGRPVNSCLVLSGVLLVLARSGA